MADGGIINKWPPPSVSTMIALPRNHRGLHKPGNKEYSPLQAAKLKKKMRDKLALFGRPVPRQPAHSPQSHSIYHLVLTDGIPPAFRGGVLLRYPPTCQRRFQNRFRAFSPSFFFFCWSDLFMLMFKENSERIKTFHCRTYCLARQNSQARTETGKMLTRSRICNRNG